MRCTIVIRSAASRVRIQPITPKVEADMATPSLASNAPATKHRTALVELALAVGGFGIGAGEFAIMGLLPNVADDLRISTPTAGHVISSYALGVVIGAPIISVLCARLSRRMLLLVLMAVFVLGNFASALAPSYGSLMLL